MPLPNRQLNYLQRGSLYQLKRQYGGTIDIYKLVESDTDVRTGEKTVTKNVYHVERAIVLPARRSRVAEQSISQISSDKAFVMGGSYDMRSRNFIVDRRDVPSLPDLTADDWIVYRNTKFQIQLVESFEYDAGWVITARELVGEVPEQIIFARADNYLSLEQTLED
jgi:hypothetical protein